MTPSRRSPVRVLAGPPALLEPLADSRVAVLHLARQAKEAKDVALAKQMSDQGQALKAEIARHGNAAHAAWKPDAKTLLPRVLSAQRRLAPLIEAGEKSVLRRANLTRALAAVFAILSLSRKVL